MIQINCTNCKALLQIDDAFAGGVCRCRYCGTIQTVPKHLKDANGDGASVAAAASASVGSGKTAKTLYQKKRSAVLDPGGGSGSGLDDLAGIVASSGLTSGRLQKKAGSAPATKKKQDHTLTIVLASAGALVVLLLGIIIFMALKDRGPVEEKPQTPDNGFHSTVPENNTTTPNGGTPTTPQTESSSPPAVISTPNFLGQPLTENSVVYVIDRGSASQTEGRLELAKQALLRSVRSLGSDKKFAVVFWYMEGNKPLAFPPSGLRRATQENINELQAFFDQIYVMGQTKTSLALDHACKTGAEAVVLMPMKILLDDGFVNGVMTARGKSKAKLYCVTLEQPDLATWLKKIASLTHGAYRDVSLAEARRITSGG